MINKAVYVGCRNTRVLHYTSCIGMCLAHIVLLLVLGSNSLSLSIYLWAQQSGRDKVSQAFLPSSSSDWLTAPCSHDKPNSSFSSSGPHSVNIFCPHWPPIGRAQNCPPMRAQCAGLNSSWRNWEEVILTAEQHTAATPPSAKKVNLTNRSWLGRGRAV